MDIGKINLRLLQSLEAIHRHGALTSAGVELGLTQPALSHALNNLRELFGDELFVRSARGMRSTPKGDELAGSARRILATVRAELGPSAPFGPESPERTFRIAMTDVGELVLLPTLMKHIRERAPRVSIICATLPPRSLAEALEMGTIDMAVGPFPDLSGADLKQQVIFERGVMCLISENHPRIKTSRLSLKQFLSEPHLTVSSSGRLVEVFEQFLERERLSRRVVLSVPHMLSVPSIVAASDLIATVPESIGTEFRNFPRLRVVRPPVKAPQIKVALYWSVRFNKDSGNAWLRSLFLQLFRTRNGRFGLPFDHTD